MDEIKAANESLLGKLQDLSGTNTGEDVQAEEKTEDYFVEWWMCWGVRGEGDGRSYQWKYTPCCSYRSQSYQRSEHFVGGLLWRKQSYDFIQLFVSLHDTSKYAVNVVLCWNFKKNLPYRMLRCKDVKQVKGGKKKLSNMKTLVKHVMRAAVIANWNDFVVTFWSPRKVMDLYVGVKHFFDFLCLTYEKRRRYEIMSWKTYFNAFVKSQGRLFGEKWWFHLMVKRLVQSGKIFIIIIINFNAFTNQYSKPTFLCLEKTQGTRKKNALPSPPKHLQSSWPLCTPIPPNHCPIIRTIDFIYECVWPIPLSCGLENNFYLWVPVHFHRRKISRSRVITTSNRIFDIRWNLSHL